MTDAPALARSLWGAQDVLKAHRLLGNRVVSRMLSHPAAARLGAGAAAVVQRFADRFTQRDILVSSLTDRQLDTYLGDPNRFMLTHEELAQLLAERHRRGNNTEADDAPTLRQGQLSLAGKTIRVDARLDVVGGSRVVPQLEGMLRLDGHAYGTADVSLHCPEGLPLDSVRIGVIQNALPESSLNLRYTNGLKINLRLGRQYVDPRPDSAPFIVRPGVIPLQVRDNDQHASVHIPFDDHPFYLVRYQDEQGNRLTKVKGVKLLQTWLVIETPDGLLNLVSSIWACDWSARLNGERYDASGGVVNVGLNTTNPIIMAGTRANDAEMQPG